MILIFQNNEIMQKSYFPGSYLFLLLLAACSPAEKQVEETGTPWQYLFDGEKLEGWKPVGGAAEFEIQDSAIVGIAKANTPNTFLVTEEIYDDFILELDLKIEDESSNSGIMIRGQYDAEAKDGAGLVYGYQIEADPTARAWSGGLYDEERRGWLYPLDLNPEAKEAFKMGEWNTYRVEAIGNTIKSWINGQEVAYVVDDMDTRGFIGLQVHSIYTQEDEGNKTWFRNIRIQTENLEPKPFESNVFVVNTGLNNLTDYEKETGWELLFDGNSTEKWVGAYKDSFPEAGWVINDQVLTVKGADGGESTNWGDIVTKEEFSAFDLGFDFKLTETANSGVKYFVTLSEGNEGSAIGLEYQILDDERHPDAKMGKDGNRTLASLYDLKTADKQQRFLKPIGEWNKGRIIVHPDNKVEHFLNGIKVLEYQRASEEYRNLVAESKYKVWDNFGEAEKGHILLQDHGDKVSFKNLKIRSLQ